MNGRRLALLSGGAPRRPRPAGQVQPPLPPFDPSEPGGIVHTILPPEFQPGTVPYFLQGDFNGVTLQGKYVWQGTPAQPGSSIKMTSGPWTGLVIPFLVGANSTPPTMLMTPMLPLYPAAVIDAALTEHAWRSYPDLTIADIPWNAAENGVAWTPQKTVQFAKLLKSWGFRVPLWSNTPINGDPTFRAMLNASCVDFFVPGEEIATSPDHSIPAEMLPPLLDTALNDCGGGVPLAVHLGPNGPLGFPCDTFLDGGPDCGSWGQYNGKVGLAWEGGNKTEVPNPPGVDPAGTMGALLYYARTIVNLGVSGDGQFGVAAPDSSVYVWELLASQQLEGIYDEPYGNLRTYEMLCCPNGNPPDPRVRQFGGYNNGGRMPSGVKIF